MLMKLSPEVFLNLLVQKVHFPAKICEFSIDGPKEQGVSTANNEAH